jgi:glucose/arabinose dehydrogenase
MFMKFLYTIALLAGIAPLAAQPGTTHMTPIQNEALHEVAVEVPAKFQSVFSARKVYLPQGYKARVFYAGGLSRPRFMTFSPSGVLHFSDMGSGKIYAVPDINKDGIADTIITVATGFSNNHDLTFYNGNLYVTEERKVWKLTDANSDGVYESRVVFIDTIAAGAVQPGGGHTTRTIVFDSVNQKAYLSIGSSCNVCREDERAIIEQYNTDGSGRRTFASGTRNAVGMTLHPVTNKLWANNNGSDQQGDNIPPEWTDIVRDNGFYGHPFAHSNQVYFNFNAHADYQALLPITKTDSDKVKKMVEPAALFQAHSAPMAIQFLNSSFPSKYRNGIIMAVHGSWNRTVMTGHKLIYMDLSNPQDTTVNFISNFCTGFLTDSFNSTRWARPVGLAVDNSGNIYMGSDDINRFIMVIYPDGTTGINDQPGPDNSLKVYPNPANGILHLQAANTAQQVNISMSDINGRAVWQKSFAADHAIQEQIDTQSLAPGLYFLKINGDKSAEVRKVMIE